MTLGERIRVARRSAGLSQKVLAESLGVDQATLSRWERGGQGGPGLGDGVAIANLTGCSLRWLATGIGDSGIATGEAAA